MKLKISSLLLILVFAFSFTSCEEDELTTDVVALLTAQTWTYENATSDDALVSALLPLVDLAYEGVTYDFNEDGSYTQTFADFPFDGTWELSADEKQITLDKETEYEEIYNLTVTETIMSIEKEGLSFNYN